MVFENHSIMYHPPQQGKTHIHTAKEKGDENMIRIEILFDRQSTKNLKSGTLQALQNEIEQRLKPHYPEIWLHMWESPSFRVRSCQPALH